MPSETGSKANASVVVVGMGYWGKNSEAVFKRFNSWLVA